VVLLIDEVDRADEALEAVLLETLGEFQISVPEVGTFSADDHRPYVLLTSNNTRDLAAALKRRCLHLFLDYPSAERELEIVRSKKTGLADALAEELINVVRGLRELELRKAPSISETIDWAQTLAVLGVDELSAQVLSDTVSVVVKYDKDLKKALDALPRLVDPNAYPPGAHEHRHGQGHGHDHSDFVRSDHAHGEDPGDADGLEVRAAKDQPGRHGEGVSGTSGHAKDAASAATARPRVPPGQGSRSFRRGRKRAL
jgi:MoxR-like ATPase